MNLRGTYQRRLARGAVLVAILVMVGSSYAASNPPEGAVVGEEKAWRDSVGLIERGQFEDATAKMSSLASSDATVVKLSGWLDQLNEQEQMRAEMTLVDYQQYVAWSKKYHAKKDYSKALEYSVRALNNAVSKDAYRQEEWVRKLIDDAMTEAAELRQKKEWLDALSIYYQIGEIYEHDAAVRKLIRECRTHARLDALYTDDTSWEERLVGIEPNMVEQAFREVNNKYVEDADFRTITEAGLEQMLLMTESASLHALFESLEDELERGAFEARIRANLAKVRSLPTCDFKVARAQFHNALRINRQTIQLPEELVINEYMEGCLEELDEFTAMIWPSSYKEFEKHTRGDFVGVGISIRRRYNTDLKDYEVYVVSPIEDSPAYDAGIQTGDIITKVNGEPLLGMSLNKAVETITGPQGTSVLLSVRRESETDDLVYSLERKKIKIHSIKGFARDPQDDQKWQYMIDPEMGIGYIRVLSFQENTVEDLVQTINGLAAKNLRGLVLDLRFNPGGLLRSAVQFSELFLDKGETIVSTRGLRSPKWEISARRRGDYRDLPLVVLVNDSSASASEIVAGAIKDHNRGLIIGERTFGKFSVQNLIQLARTEAHLKLTTARYYLPSGRSLHRDDDSVEWGVEPDISIPLVAKEQVKIVQGFRKRDIIGAQADELAQKIISDEEADLKAEIERVRQEAEEKDKDKTPDAVEPEGPKQGDTEPGDDAKSADVEEAKAEEEVDRNDRPDIDPQLDAALLVMRAHLLDLQYQMVARNVELSEEPHQE